MLWMCLERASTVTTCISINYEIPLTGFAIINLLNRNVTIKKKKLICWKYVFALRESGLWGVSKLTNSVELKWKDFFQIKWFTWPTTRYHSVLPQEVPQHPTARQEFSCHIPLYSSLFFFTVWSNKKIIQI